MYIYLYVRIVVPKGLKPNVQKPCGNNLGVRKFVCEGPDNIVKGSSRLRFPNTYIHTVCARKRCASSLYLSISFYLSISVYLFIMITPACDESHRARRASKHLSIMQT